MTSSGNVEGSTYAQAILSATFRFANRPAMKWKEGGLWRTASYSELREDVVSLVAGLKLQGLARGDHIGIWLETGRHWIVCDLAIQVLGAVTVPIYHTLTAEKARKILEDAGAKALFSTTNRFTALRKSGPPFYKEFSADANTSLTHETLKTITEAGRLALRNKPSLRQEIETPQVSAEDLSAIIYTSGTTGEPKGAMITHGSVIANAKSGIAGFLKANQEHRVFLHLPMAHVVGRNAVEAMTLLSGGMLAIAEPEREKLVSNLQELQPTHVVTVPYVLGKFHTQVIQKISQRPAPIRWLFSRAMSNARKYRVEPVLHGGPVKLKNSVFLRLFDKLFFQKIRSFLGGYAEQIVTGAAHINHETLEFFWAIGIPIYEGYGMTELTSNASYTWSGDIKLGTVGKPTEGTEIKLAADGEILIRGKGLMKGYWNKPEATREAIDSEGWYHTGDIGRMSEDGYLSIVDRKKEIFVLSTGKNVAPQSVENTIKLSPFVENACVFGDKRNYMTALIVPEWSAVIKKLGLTEKPPWHHPDVQKLFQGEIKRLMEALPDYEKVKKFSLVEEPFSVDSGLMTPTLKLRRKQIEERYSDQIESLYSGPQSNFWFFEDKK